MTEMITGLTEDDITTEWRRERASEVGTDDDATDPGTTDTTDGTDGDSDGTDGDADGTDA